MIPISTGSFLVPRCRIAMGSVNRAIGQVGMSRVPS